jgi:hypothetical protein
MAPFRGMQTTLDLDPSALDAARQLALHEKISLDEAVSKLILQAASFRDEIAAGFWQLDRGDYLEVDRDQFLQVVTGKK